MFPLTFLPASGIPLARIHSRAGCSELARLRVAVKQQDGTAAAACVVCARGFEDSRQQQRRDSTCVATRAHP